MSGLERIEGAAVGAFHTIAALFEGELDHPATKRLEELRAMPYREYLQTQEWQEIRRSMVRASGYKCQRCGCRNTKLDVHHLTYERRGEEAREDLEVICRDCHEFEHGIRRLSR